MVVVAHFLIETFTIYGVTPQPSMAMATVGTVIFGFISGAGHRMRSQRLI
jgi:hypothetical protein